MQQIILTIILFFSSVALTQAQENTNNLNERSITVTVNNVLNNEGTVNFAIFDKENFRKRPLYAKSSTIENGVSKVNFLNVPKGKYAIICYHDENKNGRMDFYENGMPKESYGTSNNPMLMGPPNFESSKFEVNAQDLNLEIKF